MTRARKKTVPQVSANHGKYEDMMPILPLMFLIFMTLKLCGVIAWSWWLVTAPLWAGVLVVALLIAVFGSIAVVLAAFGTKARNRF